MMCVRELQKAEQRTSITEIVGSLGAAEVGCMTQPHECALCIAHGQVLIAYQEEEA